MTMRRWADLYASLGEFTDYQGRRAKRSQRVGVVMRDTASGAMAIKLDLVPVRPDWSGWLAVRNVDDDDTDGGGTP